MKKTYTFILILLISLSCKKNKLNYEDYFPKLSISSEVLNNGRLKLTCNIEGEKFIPSDYVGFAFGDSINFKISTNQTIVSSNSDKSFSYIYPKQFAPNRTYFFKAWFMNEGGIAESEVLQIDSITATSVNPPCTNSDDIISYKNTTASTSNTSAFLSTNSEGEELRIYFNGYALYIQFKMDPITGEYDTKTDFLSPYPEVNPYECKAKVQIGTGWDGNPDYINSDQHIYIQKNTDGTRTVIICDASTSKGNTISTKFTF